MDTVQEDLMIDNFHLCGCLPCDCQEDPTSDDWDVEHCWLCLEPMSGRVCNVCGESEIGNWLAWLE